MKVLANIGFFIEPYKNKKLEVIRNNETITIYDGHVKKGDQVTVDEKLGHKLTNTIFGKTVLASIIETETESEDIQEEETESEDIQEEETESEDVQEEETESEDVQEEETESTDVQKETLIADKKSESNQKKMNQKGKNK